MNKYRNPFLLFSRKTKDVPAIYAYLIQRRLYYTRLTFAVSLLALLASAVCYMLSSTGKTALTILGAAVVNIGVVAWSDVTLSQASKLSVQGTTKKEARYDYLDRLINHFGNTGGFLPWYGWLSYIVLAIMAVCLATSIF